jgi:periplasmic divalent cation tolerance protein
MERAVLVYATYSSVIEAERASREMVERRLAASASIFPRVVSYTWHEDTVERGEEAVAVFKTRTSVASALSVAIKEQHRSPMAPILVIPVEGADAGHHAWIVEETTA